MLGRLVAPICSLGASGLTGSLLICTIPGGPPAEEDMSSTEQQRALSLQISSTGAMALSSLGWNVLALLDLPRRFMPILWTTSLACYVVALMWRGSSSKRWGE